MRNEGGITAHLKTIAKNNRLLYTIATTLLGRRPVIGGLNTVISGRKNTILRPHSAIFVNCEIDIVGDNNRIDIGDFCSLNNVTILIRGNNNLIHISESVRFNHSGSLHIEDDGCLINIGHQTTFEGAHIAVTEPGSQVIIGRDCMFAYDIDLRTGDSHSIIDTRTNRRINYAKDISVDDHVWIAPHCSILKGVQIRRNCIVSTRTVLTKTFDREGVIIGGSPARILKEHVTWDRRRLLPTDKAIAYEKSM